VKKKRRRRRFPEKEYNFISLIVINLRHF